MKLNYFDTIVVFTILPVFFFIIGCLVFMNNEMTSSINQSSDIFVLLLLTAAGSYLFLRDLRSVFIGIMTSVNTFLGTLFLIDIFEIKFDLAVIPAFSIVLAFGVLVNTSFLLYIHQNKKASDATPAKAVSQASGILPAVFMCWIILILMTFSDLVSVVSNNFKRIIALGGLSAVVNVNLLLPILSNFLLGHINEEKQQDDLDFSFSEKKLNRLNQVLDDTIAKILWIISPIIYYKKIAIGIFVLFIAMVSFVLVINFEDLFFINTSKEKFLAIAFLSCFFISVYRYKSYILALIPAIIIFSNCIFYAAFCNSLNWNSIFLSKTVFFGAMAISVLGAYSYTDQIIIRFKETKNLIDTLLDTSARVSYILFGSALTMMLFLLGAISMYGSESIFWMDIFWAGIIIMTSTITIIFPVPVIARVLFTFYQYVRKPRKKKIKSIYL